MNTSSQLGVVNICSVNPHNCLWSPFPSCGNWVLPLAHRIHIQGPYSWPSQVIAVLCFPPTSHGPLGTPGNVLPASCCLSKALLKWHLRWEAHLQSSTPEFSRLNMAPYADLLMLFDGSLSQLSVLQGRKEAGHSPLLHFLSFVQVPAHCFQLTGEIGLLILLGRDPHGSFSVLRWFSGEEAVYYQHLGGLWFLRGSLGLS